MRGSYLSSLDVAIEVEPGKTNRRAEDTCASFMALADPQYKKEIAVAVIVDPTTGQTNQVRASRIVLDAVTHYLLSHPISYPPDAISSSIQAAHAALLERKRTDPELTDSGVAVTVALIAFDREIIGIVELYVGNVGRNRAYHFRKGVLSQLAADPSGTLSPAEPEHLDPAADGLPPHRRALTHVVGMPGPLVLQISPVELLGRGDLVLLCTHRLTEVVKDDALVTALASNKSDGGARELLMRAREQAGDDNLAVMTLRLVPGPYNAGARAERVPLSLLVMFALIGVALLLGLVALMIVRGQAPSSLVPNTATIEVAQFQPVRRTPTVRPTPGSRAGTSIPPIILLPFMTPLPPNASAPTLEPFSAAQPTERFLAPQPTERFLASTPILVGPIDGQVFDRGAPVYLTWTPMGILPQEIYYAVTLSKSRDGVTIDTYEYFTKQTTIQIPPALMAGLHNARPPSAVAWNANAAIGLNENMAADSQTRFEWYLTLKRLLQGSPDVNGDWIQLGSPSQVFTFLLREPAATATPGRYP